MNGDGIRAPGAHICDLIYSHVNLVLKRVTPKPGSTHLRIKSDFLTKRLGLFLSSVFAHASPSSPKCHEKMLLRFSAPRLLLACVMSLHSARLGTGTPSSVRWWQTNEAAGVMLLDARSGQPDEIIQCTLEFCTCTSRLKIHCVRAGNYQAGTCSTSGFLENVLLIVTILY